jgi:hypothetical protein
MLLAAAAFGEPAESLDILGLALSLMVPCFFGFMAFSTPSRLYGLIGALRGAWSICALFSSYNCICDCRPKTGLDCLGSALPIFNTVEVLANAGLFARIWSAFTASSSCGTQSKSSGTCPVVFQILLISYFPISSINSSAILYPPPNRTTSLPLLILAMVFLVPNK